jgi:hypothetical protein
MQQPFLRWVSLWPPNRFPTQLGEEKECEMNLSKSYKAVILGLALLLATSAFAINKGSLQVSDPLNVAGTQLKPGSYTVKWDGTGANVDVSIVQNNKVVATVPARRIDLSQAPSSDAAVVKINGDGSRSLSEIRFSGKKFALAVGSEQAQADSTK